VRKPAPPPPPAVTVTYAAVDQWGSGFEGRLTIVNHGTATISAWEIAISLPGDRVSSVWDAVGHVDGDVLILQPTTWDPPITPNGEMSVNFVADGPTTSPASCTYNGAACA
jgi:chitinase